MKNLFKVILLLTGLLSSFAFAQGFNEFEWIMEESLRLRQEMIDNQEYLEKISEKGHTMTGVEIEFVNNGVVERAKLSKSAHEFLHYLDYTVIDKIKKNEQISNDRVKDTMMFLALAVTMADNYLFAYAKIDQNAKLRRLIDSPDTAIGKEKNSFKKARREFFKFKNRKMIKRAIKIYKKHYLAKKDSLGSDIELEKLEDAIQMSYTYEKLADMKFEEKIEEFFGIIGMKIGNSFKLQGDFFTKLGNGIVFGLSKFFGNSVGQLQSRRGKLFMDQKFIKDVQNTALPMDLVFEKTPFRATDKFIPGYWGHAAIYIGNESQIKALGLWDHPVVTKFHNDIRLGKTIVEALRPGVQFNTIRHFTDIDDFALVRKRVPFTDDELRDHIIRALNQVGKKYDFGFDTEVPNKIVCSELHYTVLKDIKFETSPYVGRQTISVDQTVVQATAGMPFEPILLYVDGEKIERHIQEVYDMIYNDSEYNITKVRALDNEVATEEVQSNLN